MSCYHTPCGNPNCRTCYPDPCDYTSGCPLQLDASCVIYHKQNNEVSGLTNLALPNGATLELILEQIDTNLEGFNPSAFALPVLREQYVVHSLKQFMQAVDTEIGNLSDQAVLGGYLGEFTSDPSAENGQYWYNTSSSLLKIRLQNTNKTIQLI